MPIDKWDIILVINLVADILILVLLYLNLMNGGGYTAPPGYVPFESFSVFSMPEVNLP